MVGNLHKLPMKGPQRIPGAVLRAEVLKNSSKIQRRLRHSEHWHHWHHWHHHHWWVWGAYAFLPASTSHVVVGVPSGNTLSVSGVPQTVRLAGVGAPLPGQAFFSESQEGLQAIAGGQHVRLFWVGTDFDGSMVAQVFLDDGTYVNERQIRDGMAWYAADDWADMSLGFAEEQAQATGTGLWGGDYSEDF